MALIWRRVLAAAIVTASISALPRPMPTAAERVARDLGVVTYNQYLGADSRRCWLPPAGQFNAALLGVLEEVAANRFPARAATGRADRRYAPDLVGLQEVWRYVARICPRRPAPAPAPGFVARSSTSCR